MVKGGNRLDRATVIVLVIRAQNLGSQGVWRIRGRREERWGGGWDHFAEKVCHEGGGNPKGLEVGWAWVMEWYSGKIELLEQSSKS